MYTGPLVVGASTDSQVVLTECVLGRLAGVGAASVGAAPGVHLGREEGDVSAGAPRYGKAHRARRLHEAGRARRRAMAGGHCSSEPSDFCVCKHGQRVLDGNVAQRNLKVEEEAREAGGLDSAECLGGILSQHGDTPHAWIVGRVGADSIARRPAGAANDKPLASSRLAAESLRDREGLVWAGIPGEIVGGSRAADHTAAIWGPAHGLEVPPADAGSAT